VDSSRPAVSTPRCRPLVPTGDNHAVLCKVGLASATSPLLAIAHCFRHPIVFATCYTLPAAMDNRAAGQGGALLPPAAAAVPAAAPEQPNRYRALRTSHPQVEVSWSTALFSEHPKVSLQRVLA